VHRGGSARRDLILDRRASICLGLVLDRRSTRGVMIVLRFNGLVRSNATVSVLSTVLGSTRTAGAMGTLSAVLAGDCGAG
jgi:hypothetical protein